MSEQDNGMIEVEVKVLLGDIRSAELFRRKVLDEVMSCIGGQGGFPAWGSIGGVETQTNHYFEGDEAALRKAVDRYEKKHVYVSSEFHDQIPSLKKFSVRTRNDRLWNSHSEFIVKATLNDTSSENGTARREYTFGQHDIPQDELDQILVDAGFRVQAKWSRERETYMFLSLSSGYRPVTITIDRNSGYGYLAELEIMSRVEDVEASRHYIDELMKLLKVRELDQARLERMFAYYNANWEHYYLKDEFFVIE